MCMRLRRRLCWWSSVFVPSIFASFTAFTYGVGCSSATFGTVVLWVRLQPSLLGSGVRERHLERSFCSRSVYIRFPKWGQMFVIDIWNGRSVVGPFTAFTTRSRGSFQTFGVFWTQKSTRKRAFLRSCGRARYFAAFLLALSAAALRAFMFLRCSGVCAALYAATRVFPSTAAPPKAIDATSVPAFLIGAPARLRLSSLSALMAIAEVFLSLRTSAVSGVYAASAAIVLVVKCVCSFDSRFVYSLHFWGRMFVSDIRRFLDAKQARGVNRSSMSPEF